jgi:hypothetical protein
VAKPQASGNVTPIRRSLPRERIPKPPPAISIFDTPLFIQADVKVARLMHGLAAAGLRLRFDPHRGRFLIDDKSARV